ncbi:hypothetical protein LOTGIDRAFT_160226 [Lottia gigantea]|uniref:Phospholipid scramblase n=1 Tax=Lottia gigantea TaxID=225164 RepID=V4ALN8_LOTGI|nr:hypothetical protein LOTGIDRAFT_160226 [Lottia gigantea]ESO95675.1 hypothetical protein LOTGIDRAFT_160226 [Lottia gigantea]
MLASLAKVTPAFNDETCGAAMEPISSQPTQPIVSSGGRSEFAPEAFTCLPQWMNRPDTYKSGLEYLAKLDRVQIQTITEKNLDQGMDGSERVIRYKLLNPKGEQVYKCKKEFTGESLKSDFSLFMVDFDGKEVFHVDWEYKCYRGFFCCCGCMCHGRELAIQIPPGTPAAHVGRIPGCCGSPYNVVDSYGKQIFQVTSQWCIFMGCVCLPCSVCQPSAFYGHTVTNTKGVPVAYIAMLDGPPTGPVGQETYMANLGFDVSFYEKISIREKALVIAVGFLISNDRVSFVSNVYLD